MSNAATVDTLVALIDSRHPGIVIGAERDAADYFRYIIRVRTPAGVESIPATVLHVRDWLGLSPIPGVRC